MNTQDNANTSILKTYLESTKSVFKCIFSPIFKNGGLKENFKNAFWISLGRLAWGIIWRILACVICMVLLPIYLILLPVFIIMYVSALVKDSFHPIDFSEKETATPLELFKEKFFNEYRFPNSGKAALKKIFEYSLPIKEELDEISLIYPIDDNVLFKKALNQAEIFFEKHNIKANQKFILFYTLFLFYKLISSTDRYYIQDINTYLKKELGQIRSQDYTENVFDEIHKNWNDKPQLFLTLSQITFELLKIDEKCAYTKWSTVKIFIKYIGFYYKYNNIEALEEICKTPAHIIYKAYSTLPITGVPKNVSNNSFNCLGKYKALVKDKPEFSQTILNPGSKHNNTFKLRMKNLYKSKKNYKNWFLNILVINTFTSDKESKSNKKSNNLNISNFNVSETLSEFLDLNRFKQLPKNLYPIFKITLFEMRSNLIAHCN